MVNLLDLPNELLQEIVSYLQPHPPDPIHGRPYHHGVTELGKRSRAALKLARSLILVALTCRRLRDIAVERLQRYVPLYTDGERSRILLSVLATRGQVFSHVRFVDVKATAPGYGLMDTRSLFWLPNIHTLCIRNFDLLESWDHISYEHVCSSPVQVLKLIGCNVSGEHLHEVFSWPKALKELWYNDWTRRYERDWIPGIGWPSEIPEFLKADCYWLVRAMSTQADSLEKFVFTRQRNSYFLHDDDCDALDVRNFKKLKCLFVDHALLAGYSRSSLRRRLPESLEELEVYYSDPRLTFSRPTVHDYYHDLLWLTLLLHHMSSTRKQSNIGGVSMPLLRRIRIVSWDPVEEHDEGPQEIDESMDMGQRLVSSGLTGLDVDLRFFLHKENRCRYIEEY
ncbi:hypothetical protein Hte_006633 [Hypoxylon texense]